MNPFSRHRLLLRVGLALFPLGWAMADNDRLTQMVENRGDDRQLQPARMTPYKTTAGRELQLHVFEPQGLKSNDQRYCFVIFHGGGWVGGAPQEGYRFVSLFSKMGLVGISVEYRLLRRDGVTPVECAHDARSAIRYIRAHAAELGIDPDKIVVSGSSAGGHLAVGTALFDGMDDPGDDLGVSCVPNALVLLFPVLDTSINGFGHGACGDAWATLSPLHRVKAGAPPTLIFHGARDRTAPFAGAQRFTAEMIAVGNSCELVVNEEATHAYFKKNPRPIFLDTMKRICGFLAEHGFAGENERADIVKGQD